MRKENIDISFYGTVYNSAKYIKRSLTSIAETALKLKTYGLTSEIVIVDNYSSDGTWEIMNRLKDVYVKEGVYIKLIRYKCSRGLGRDIALRFTNGKYLFFISDLDMEYDANYLAEIIVNYMKNIKCLEENACLYIFLTPKSAALQAGGIHDLNRAEDIEFGARLLKHCIMLPMINDSLRPITFNKFMKSLDMTIRPRFFIWTYTSEIRYTKGFKDYIRREFGNKINMISGMGYTWKKIFYEAIRLRELTGFKLFIWIIYHLIFYILAKLLRKEIYNHSDFINNGSLCDVAMFLNYIALVIKLLRINKIPANKACELINDLLQNKNKFKIYQYYLALNFEAFRNALRGYYFTGE